MTTGSHLMHFIKVAIGIGTVGTQTTYAEQEAIRHFCTGKDKAVEIGVFEGLNTSIIAKALKPSGIVFGIDPFFTGRLNISYTKLITKITLSRKKVGQKVTLIEKISSEAIDDIPDGIDFVFVDGDHSFEGVCDDFFMYSAKLAPSGIIAFHDARLFENGWTGSDWGPVRLIQEVVIPSKEWKILNETDSLVIISRT